MARFKTPAKRSAARTRCLHIIKVSKHLEGAMTLTPGEPCKCECPHKGGVQTIFQVTYKSKLRFQSVEPCDESEREQWITSGFSLVLMGELKWRLDFCREDRRPVLIGCNHGTFEILGSSGSLFGKPVAFCGTEGLLPMEKGPARCCAPGHGLGSFCAEKIVKRPGWSFCATYHSIVRELNPDKLCAKQTRLEIAIDLDGVLIGPCDRDPVARKSKL